MKNPHWVKRLYESIDYPLENFVIFNNNGNGEITEELEQIIMKRVIDISVYCPKVNVQYNGEPIPMSSFKDYMSMYISSETYFSSNFLC